MSRHASVDQLADLQAGALRPRKAARIERHMASCPQCTQTSSELAGVPSLLASASAQYPAMPGNLSARMDTVLATESRQREASAPATESGRRDLPAGGAPPPRHRRQGRGGSGWKLPGLSVTASRALAGAAAAVVVGGAGYAVASQLTGSSSSGSPGAPAAVHGAAGAEHVGPKITYGNARTAHSIQVVTSSTNFESGKLADQVTAAVHEARQQGVQSRPAPSGTAATTHSPLAGANVGTQSEARLAGCIGLVAPGRDLILVEEAKFEGKPADIIVTSGTSSGPAQVWVVGQSCSATHSDVLDHLDLPRI